ncbi:MAG: phage tail protein [Magnetococcales bacterium]|nr:phage tail protein [Magnetococcales bacterium]
MSDPFFGEIRMITNNYAPRNWAYCDGQLLRIDQNSVLYAVIGTTYGGDGRTTMGVPNLQGRTPVHAGRGVGLSLRIQGELGGYAHVTLIKENLPPHTHQVRALNQDATKDKGSNSELLAKGYDPKVKEARRPRMIYNDGQSMQQMSPDAVGATGNAEPIYNVQPSTCIPFIMCLDGIWPQRS